jgi:hypothetical protein
MRAFVSDVWPTGATAHASMCHMSRLPLHFCVLVLSHSGRLPDADKGNIRDTIQHIRTIFGRMGELHARIQTSLHRRLQMACDRWSAVCFSSLLLSVSL